MKKHDSIPESEFEDLDLSKSKFTNINLSKAVFHDVNASDLRMAGVNLSGASFQHIGPPPNGSGEKPRGITFASALLPASTFTQCDISKATLSDVNLSDSKMTGVNLSGATLKDCDWSKTAIVGGKRLGMTIDGIPVADLLKAYKERK